MSALDLTSILTQAAATRKANDTGAQQISDIQKQQAAAVDDNVDLLGIIGANDSIMTLAKIDNQEATNLAVTHAANILGTNLRDQSERITALTDTIHQEYAKKEEALKIIEEKDSVGLFDNPIEWLINQFTINDDIARHNAANARLGAAENQLQKLNELTQTTATTQKLVDESITATTKKAAMDNLAAATKVKQNEEKNKSLTYNAEAIKTILGAQKDDLQIAFSVFGAQKQQEQIGIALAHLDLDRQRFDWQKQEKDDLKKGDSYTIEKINQGGRLMMGEGWQDIPADSAKAKDVLANVRSNSPIGKLYQEAYMTAERSMAIDPTGQTRQLATSPAHAIELLNTLPVRLSPAQKPVKELLDLAKEATAQKIAQGKLDGKNKGAVEADLNETVKQLLQDQARNVKPGDPDNVYNIGSLPVLIKSSPTIQNLPVVQKVITPAIAAGADLSDPNKLFSTVATALRDKNISYAEALDLTTIYHVGVGANLESRQLTSLGMVPSYSYNTKIQTNPVATFGDTEIVDLTKPDVVGRALNKWMAAAANPFAQNSWR